MKVSARLLCLLIFCLGIPPAAAAAEAEREEWHPLAVIRFGNADALDEEDGPAAAFIRNIRSDGRFLPPMRTLAGPEIRNPTFLGLAQDAWMECLVMAPVRAGALERVWVFQADDRDEYMRQLSSHGLGGYEGMDGVTILREAGPDGDVRIWHLEWLPGNVAVFGARRSAVRSAHRLYLERSAARGLLASSGSYIEPDITVFADPARILAWQDQVPGRYRWRTLIEMLTRDLINFLRPAPARARLLRSLADDAAAWPRAVESLRLSVWLERQGIEWRLDAAGDFPPPGPRGNFELMRALPQRTAAGGALPFGRAEMALLGEQAAGVLLAAAGGAVTGEARLAASALWEILQAAGPREAATAWISPPSARPELGGSRMLLMDWEHPGGAAAVWPLFLEALSPGSPLTQALAQMGIRFETADTGVPGTAVLAIYPAGDGEAVFSAVAAARYGPAGLALVWGRSGGDADTRRDIAAYRAALAEEALENAASGHAGSPEVRQVFVRMGPRGASLAAFLDPVRFAQFALAETADWGARSLDQPDPEPVRLAREMLEYDAAGAWPVIGEAESGGWRFSGGLPWDSLIRLSAALGVTEAIVQ